nr:unnamed protein product [Spirometra erinaceieuropaei]
MSPEVTCGGELEEVIAPKGTIQAVHGTEISPPPLLPTLSAAAANNLPATSQSTTLLPLVTNTSHLHPTPPLHPTYITRLNPAPHTHYATSTPTLTLTLASGTEHIHSHYQLPLLPLSLFHITHPANSPLASLPLPLPHNTLIAHSCPNTARLLCTLPSH